MPRRTAKNDVINVVSIAFIAVHRLQVLYCNAKAYNVLYDQNSNRIIIIDFKRAKINRELFSTISSNKKKKKYSVYLEKQKRYDFARELLSIILNIQQYIQQLIIQLNQGDLYV